MIPVRVGCIYAVPRWPPFRKVDRRFVLLTKDLGEGRFFAAPFTKDQFDRIPPAHAVVVTKDLYPSAYRIPGPDGRPPAPGTGGIMPPIPGKLAMANHITNLPVFERVTVVNPGAMLVVIGEYVNIEKSCVMDQQEFARLVARVPGAYRAFFA